MLDRHAVSSQNCQYLYCFDAIIFLNYILLNTEPSYITIIFAGILKRTVQYYIRRISPLHADFLKMLITLMQEYILPGVISPSVVKLAESVKAVPVHCP